MYNVYMVRMQIYIPESLHADLKKRCRIESIPMSEIIRGGLRKILYHDDENPSQKFDPLRDFVGHCRSRRKTDAVSEIRSHYKRNP